MTMFISEMPLPGFAAVCGACDQRINRPIVFGVTTGKFFSDLRIGVVPKRGEVAGDLDRASGRREEVKKDRNASVTDFRGFRLAKEFLEPNGKDRRLAWIVIEFDLGSRGHQEAFGNQSLQFFLFVPGQQGEKNRVHVELCQLT